jgi:hypothetical protein
VSSGGLGRDITALLRAASLPGSELVLPLPVYERVVAAGRVVGRLLGRVGPRVHTDFGEVLRGHASLSDGDARAAFGHTLSTIVGPRRQRLDASDRLYLAPAISFLTGWGERDPIISVEHTLAIHRQCRAAGSSCFRTPPTSRTSAIRCALAAWSRSSWRRPRQRRSMRAAGGSCCVASPTLRVRRRGALSDVRRAERRP